MHICVRSLRSARKLATVGMTMGVTRSLSLMPLTDIFEGACEGSPNLAVECQEVECQETVASAGEILRRLS